PSGIGVDDGTVPTTAVLPADLVVTFGGAKPGLLLPPAAGLATRVETVDVGLDLAPSDAAVARLGAADIAAAWPVPKADDHKYSRGVLGVVAGTGAYPGAAVLVTGAAVRAGIGMVRYVGDIGPAVVAAHPEVVAGQGQVQAWTLGSGVDAHDEAQASRIVDALASGLPAVVDAGALPSLPERVGPHVVLTPHAGELVRLLAARGVSVDREQVAASPLAWARRAHELTGATVLLKGAVTVVVGCGRVYAQAEAPSWLATAGAGDVLAGLLGALLAARSSDVLADPALAAVLAAVAASVHGRAAAVANPGGPVSASAVADALPSTISTLLR
ncbi:MAG TPA: NAD(P)H-hydrate dehydratase, partial [Cellulomonas sp.]